MDRFRPKRRSSLALLWRDRPISNPRFVRFVAIAGIAEAYVQDYVLVQAFQHSEGAMPNETIGLLAGRTCQDATGPYTIITATEAPRSDEVESSPSEVRISSKGYAQLPERLGLNHPVLEVVGWFHSHPSSYPIPSNEDLVEQSTWTDASSVALIVSLVSKHERFGVFQGPDAIPLFQLTSPETE